MADEDLHLCLYVCYGLHSYGIDGIDDSWEWEPSIVSLRTGLERRFEEALREGIDDSSLPEPGELETWLGALAAEGLRDRQLSSYLASRATLEQFREFVVHRSIYTLHEADPHTLAIPRISGAPKAGLVEVQVDEYGSGHLPNMHSHLFGSTMEGLGLSSEPDAYLDLVPATTLATVNLVWMFALQRRLRAALLGHLALFESTSTAPNRAYGNGLRRLGFGPAVTRYYDEHVEADAAHELIATFDVAGKYGLAHPDETQQIAFGAVALRSVEGRFADELLQRWSRDQSSLLSLIPERTERRADGPAMNLCVPSQSGAS